MRFDARHIGSRVWGIWDGGVMSWRATDLAQDEAQQQAADLKVIYNQYGQREQIAAKSTRRSRWNQPRDLLRANSITGSKSDKSGGVESAVPTDVRSGSKLRTFVR
jgi:hypothetical protein